MPSFSELYGDPSKLNDALDGAMGGLDDKFGYASGEKNGAGDDLYGGGNFGGEGGGESGGREGGGKMELVDDRYKDDDKEPNDELGNGGGGGGGADDKWGGGSGGVVADIVSEDVARPACADWKATYDVQPGISWGGLPEDLQEKWKAYDCDTYTMRW